MTESDLPVVHLTPGRWGDPAHPVALPPAALEALKHLGVRRPTTDPVDPRPQSTDRV